MNNNNHTPTPAKICPLLALDQESCCCECLAENCAWYVQSHCPEEVPGRCALWFLCELSELSRG